MSKSSCIVSIKSLPFNQFLTTSHTYSFANDLTDLVVNDLNLKRIRRESYQVAVNLIVLNLFVAYEEDKMQVVGISRDSLINKLLHDAYQL